MTDTLIKTNHNCCLDNMKEGATIKGKITLTYLHINLYSKHALFNADLFSNDLFLNKHYYITHSAIILVTTGIRHCLLFT